MAVVALARPDLLTGLADTSQVTGLATVPTFALLVAAGLLVGFGSRMAGGCTSGHTVCGLARLSRRSLAVTGVFVLATAATVYVTHHLT